MSNTNNLLMSIVGLSSAIYLYQKFNKEEDVIEPFGMLPSRTVRVDQVVQGADKQGFYTLPGTYQAMLNPRQAAVNYGAFIRYNPPDQKYRADTMGSLSYANMVKENDNQIIEGYCGGCSVEGFEAAKDGCRASAGKSSASNFSNLVPSGFAAGDYQQQYNKLNYTDTTDLLPVQQMGSMGVNALGEAAVQPIIYDRYMYANQRSKLQSVGVDRIRGDLAILPNENNSAGWFNVNANPNIDLAGGALAVIGGINNDSTRELLALKSASSGGYLNTGSGINYSVQKSSFATPSGGIRVSAFP